MPAILTIKGTEDVMRALEAMGGKLSGRVARRAVTKAARQLVAAAKAAAPKDSGALKASIGVRVKQLGGTAQGGGKRGKVGGTMYAAVGPRRKFERNGNKPSKYAHLVHNGKINADGSFTPGRPFILDAFNATKAAAIDTVTSEIAMEVKP
jgi:HK97 gp10 family phage protein